MVAGGNGHGDCLNQLNAPTYIFVDRDRSVYVSDYYNDRVMKWMEGAKEGILVAGGHDQGDALTQLSRPQGVIVDQLGTVYVADSYNHRVMRWREGETKGKVIAGDKYRGGSSANELNGPEGIAFDRDSNL